MAKGKLLHARVLVGLIIGAVALKPNDLVQGDEALIKAYKKDGALDDSKAAVDYCKNILKAKPILVEDPAIVAAEEAAAEKAAEEKVALKEKLELEVVGLTKDLVAAAEADKPAIQLAIDGLEAKLAELA